MGSGGSVAAMISSIRYNRALGKRSKPMKERMGPYRWKLTRKEPLRYKNTMSSIERQEFRNKLILKKRKHQIQIVVVFLIMFISVIVGVIWLSNL